MTQEVNVLAWDNEGEQATTYRMEVSDDFFLKINGSDRSVVHDFLHSIWEKDIDEKIPVDTTKLDTVESVYSDGHSSAVIVAHMYYSGILFVATVTRTHPFPKG